MPAKLREMAGMAKKVTSRAEADAGDHKDRKAVDTARGRVFPQDNEDVQSGTTAGEATPTSMAETEMQSDIIQRTRGG